MLIDFGTLIGLLIILFIIRVFILVVSTLLNRKDNSNDVEGTMILDFMMNAIIFVATAVCAWYKIIHPSMTVFYGFLAEIVICWLIGLIPMCMSTENHDIKEMPSGALPKFLRPWRG